MAQEFAYIGNDNILTLAGLSSAAPGSLGFTNTASVLVTVVLSGQLSGIAGQSWPSAMTLVSSELGTWQMTISDAATLTAGEFYQGIVDVEAGDGLCGKWYVPIKAIVRELK